MKLLKNIFKMKEDKEAEVFGYHIFPPFIDAYRNALWPDDLETLVEIESMMRSHAIEWGSEAIGRSVLLGKEIPKHNGKTVLCCAYTYRGKNNDPYKHFLIVIDDFCDDWYDKLQFIEGEVNDEWDVT